MKKLYIIGTIIKDWFTSQLHYTLLVLGVFVISFTALFFVSTKVASEHLDPTDREYIYYNELLVDYNLIEDNIDMRYEMFMLTDEFYEKYLAIDLPPISDMAYVSGHMSYNEKNGEKLPGTDYVEVPILPVFAPSEAEKYDVIKDLMYYDYEIISGRDISDDDLEQKRSVVVAPEGWALDVGDVISCFGRELEVIGISRPTVIGEKKNDIFRPNDDKFLVPYSFVDECMPETLDSKYTEYMGFKWDPGYRGKPENNKYEPEGVTYYSIPQSPYGNMECYAAYVVLEARSWLFSKRISESQKQQLAELIGISPDGFTNEYDLYYYEIVERFDKQAFKECIITGIFCMLNAFTVVIFLCRRNTKAYRIYRVYGCTGAWVFIINFLSMLVVIALAFGVSLLIARPAMELFHLINKKYEYRPRCLSVTSAIFLAVSVLACIPAAISAVRRSPVGK